MISVNLTQIIHTEQQSLMKNQFSLLLIRKISIFAAIFMSFGQIDAQFTEDFSDGDFEQNPPWIGMAEEFIVNTDQKLQLSDLDASESNAYLSTSAPTKGICSWEFWLKMDFSPSASNFATVYLASDQSDLLQPVIGYYVKIGGVSQDLDAIELYRSDGSSSTLLIAGEMGGVGTDPVEVRVRVTRNENFEWELFTDLSGGSNFISRGKLQDDTYDLLNYFGFECKYTSSRSEAFQFDDVLIDPIYEDKEAPSLLAVNLLESDQLELVFSEPISDDFSELQISIDQGINITNFEIDQESSTILLVSYSPSLKNGLEYNLTIEGAKDLAGNVSGQESRSFTFIKEDFAFPYEILITEIMADPSPVIGLAEAEYVEIFNSGNRNIQLNNLILSNGSADVQLPSYLMSPGEYICLVDVEDAGLFDASINLLSVNGLPAIRNSDGLLSLSANGGDLINSQSYSEDWYGDNIKKEGGYSLEMINPNAACLDEENWIGSQSLSGGTPGTENSVWGVQAVEPGAKILSVFPVSTTRLNVLFDSKLDPLSIGDPGMFEIIGGLEIVSTSLSDSGTLVTLELNGALQEGETYTLNVFEVTDCLGVVLNMEQSKDFALAAKASIGDLIINEILFNPSTGGVDFVEFYNVSDKVIDASRLLIANISDGENDIENILVETLIFPNDYFVICPSTSLLETEYDIVNPQFLHEQTLPAFADDEGNVSLFLIDAGQELIIDEFDYDEDFHNALLADKNGVSLERISKTSDTQDSGNWHSSAAANNYATPTYENSQSIEDQDRSAAAYEIINKTFSPDQDGYKDFLQLRFNNIDPGHLINIKIFDSEGRVQKTLANNELLATNGSILWDGSNSEGQQVRVGIYILYMQIISPSGGEEEYKEAVVVAKKL